MTTVGHVPTYNCLKQSHSLIDTRMFGYTANCIQMRITPIYIVTYILFILKYILRINQNDAENRGVIL